MEKGLCDAQHPGSFQCLFRAKAEGFRYVRAVPVDDPGSRPLGGRTGRRQAAKLLRADGDGALPIWEGDKIFFRLLEEERPFFSLKLSYDTENVLVRAVLDGKELSL